MTQNNVATYNSSTGQWEYTNGNALTKSLPPSNLVWNNLTRIGPTPTSGSGS